MKLLLPFQPLYDVKISLKERTLNLGQSRQKLCALIRDRAIFFATELQVSDLKYRQFFFYHYVHRCIPRDSVAFTSASAVLNIQYISAEKRGGWGFRWFNQVSFDSLGRTNDLFVARWENPIKIFDFPAAGLKNTLDKQHARTYLPSIWPRSLLNSHVFSPLSNR